MSARSRLALAGQRAQPGRTRLMVAAIALGVGAVGAIAGAQSIIERELAAEFAATLPASAEIALGPDARNAATTASLVAGVDAATTRVEYRLRLEGAEGWQQVILIASDEPGTAPVARAFAVDDGAWPPAVGQIAIERASLSEVDLAPGDMLTLVSAKSTGTVVVSGLAYDPGRNPAWLNGWVVAYTHPSTLDSLGLSSEANRLLIRSDAQSREEVRVIAADVVEALEANDIEARVLFVAEPGQHPAAGVINTLMYVLTTFGAIAVIAAIGLLVALVVADIRRQLPVIGIAKVGGATTQDLTTVFLLGVARVASLGTIFATPVGIAGAWALSTFALTLLNITLNQPIAEPWVFAVMIVLGLAVPLLATLIPVRRLSRLRARDALATAASVAGRRRPAARSRGLGGRVRQLGRRNATRQPTRLAVSVTALALGAAASMTALNTGAAWNNAVDTEFRAQDFLVQAVFTEPLEQGRIVEELSRQGLDVQLWNVGESEISARDGAPGGPVMVLAPPEGWANPGYAVLDGRWLNYGEREAVITQNMTELEVAVGEAILVGSDPQPYVVVGRVRQLTAGESGTVYVSAQPSGFAGQGLANAARLVDRSGATDGVAAVAAISASDLPIAVAVTGADAKEALDDHLFIITGLLLILAIIIGLVGLVALVETLTTAVSERRAEYAVMKVQGATSSTIARLVRTESLVVAGLSLVFATALALPMTQAVETAIGNVFLGTPLPFIWWWPALAIVAVLTLGIAAAASIIPGYEAADAPAREALAGE